MPFRWKNVKHPGDATTQMSFPCIRSKADGRPLTDNCSDDDDDDVDEEDEDEDEDALIVQRAISVNLTCLNANPSTSWEPGGAGMVVPTRSTDQIDRGAGAGP
jgi:hypothetical protein